MDILFENSYTRSKDLAKDIYTYMYFRRPAMIFIYAVLAFYLFSEIIGAFFTGQINLLLIIIPLLYYAFGLFMYFRGINTLAKRDLELYGKPAEINITVTAETLNETMASSSNISLSYDSIKKVVRTKKYIHLFTKTNVVLSFKKDSFSVGTADEFLIFLKSKGIK